MILRPSPNFDERNSPIKHLILHYTGMKTGAEAIERLCSAESKVSAHYVLEEDGQIYQLVDEAKRAWHAGISFWRGEDNLNKSSIGIEIVNTGHEFGYKPFTKSQYATLIPLCQGIKARHGIKDINIIGHSDVAPNRKADPGELFDWQLLAQNGIGLWPNQQSKIKNQKSNLVELGYQVHNADSITAFQRHWRQNNINGLWDDECGQILANLLELAGR